MADEAVEVVVTGRVQGVGYRWWARSTAQGLGLVGYVRNRSDGAVEAVVAGPPERIDAFAEACRAGPPEAEVTRVDRRTVEAAVLGEETVAMVIRQA